MVEYHTTVVIEEGNLSDANTTMSALNTQFGGNIEELMNILNAGKYHVTIKIKAATISAHITDITWLESNHGSDIINYGVDTIL
jgi:hypothetical protein